MPELFLIHAAAGHSPIPGGRIFSALPPHAQEATDSDDVRLPAAVLSEHARDTAGSIWLITRISRWILCTGSGPGAMLLQVAVGDPRVHTRLKPDDAGKDQFNTALADAQNIRFIRSSRPVYSASR